MTDGESYTRKKAFFDRVLTIYGRKPALEALRDTSLQCHALHLAESNRETGIVAELRAAAAMRDIPVQVHDRAGLSRISRNGRQDQGVALDVVCPAFRTAKEHLDSMPARPAQRLLALDGITNPQNLGMIVRSATAAAIDGILWSRRGNASLGPLVVKASAGTLYRAPLLLCPELTGTLRAYSENGFEICILSAAADRSLFEHRPRGHCIYVLGNETEGVSPAVAALADTALAIPMDKGVESLNVAVAASLIAYASRLGAYLDR